jgi:hypothetical protein
VDLQVFKKDKYMNIKRSISVDRFKDVRKKGEKIKALAHP